MNMHVYSGIIRIIIRHWSLFSTAQKGRP